MASTKGWWSGCVTLIMGIHMNAGIQGLPAEYETQEAVSVWVFDAVTDWTYFSFKQMMRYKMASQLAP